MSVELVSALSSLRGMVDSPARFVLGIDPGTKTGIATWDIKAKKFTEVDSVPIHIAMTAVLVYWGRPRQLIRVVFEDARQRTWFGPRGTPAEEAQKLQGVGSVKRDCLIWEDFLAGHGIPFTAQKPVPGATKWDADYFRKLSKWAGSTNEHGRDAAALVLGATR